MRACSDGWIITKEEYQTLHVISQGYPIQHDMDTEGRYIVVENPDFTLDNGKDPNLVISLIDKDDY